MSWPFEVDGVPIVLKKNNLYAIVTDDVCDTLTKTPTATAVPNGGQTRRNTL